MMLLYNYQFIFIQFSCKNWFSEVLDKFHLFGARVREIELGVPQESCYKLLRWDLELLHGRRGFFLGDLLSLLFDTIMYIIKVGLSFALLLFGLLGGFGLVDFLGLLSYLSDTSFSLELCGLGFLGDLTLGNFSDLLDLLDNLFFGVILDSFDLVGDGLLVLLGLICDDIGDLLILFSKLLKSLLGRSLSFLDELVELRTKAFNSVLDLLLGLLRSRDKFSKLVELTTSDLFD